MRNWIFHFLVSDLQLAAELGRSLLDRNEELENELRQQQSIIEDQTQEIQVRKNNTFTFI